LLSGINPDSIISFLNLLSGIFLSIFSISFIYFSKYNNFISYIFSLLYFFSFISLISNDEKGKNNTSFSLGYFDIFSISQWVDKL